MGIRSYFSGGTLARLSDGSYCIIRDLGLVKGGKGLRHFECLLRFGIFSKLIEIFDRPRGFFKFYTMVAPPRPKIASDSLAQALTPKKYSPRLQG